MAAAKKIAAAFFYTFCGAQALSLRHILGIPGIYRCTAVLQIKKERRKNAALLQAL